MHQGEREEGVMDCLDGVAGWEVAGGLAGVVIYEDWEQEEAGTEVLGLEVDSGSQAHPAGKQSHNVGHVFMSCIILTCVSIFPHTLRETFCCPSTSHLKFFLPYFYMA